MLIAGLSELLLVAALGFAFLHNVKNSQSLIASTAIICTGAAAIMGFMRYLELADTQSLHQSLSFISKHFAMSAFLTGLLWQRFSQKIIPYFILTITAISFILNTMNSIGVLSDAIIVFLCLYLIYKVRIRRSALIQGVLALLVLTSTLIWGAVIEDQSLLLGVFHLCLACFFILIVLASGALVPQASAAKTTFGT
jgi:hypothetical protein